MANQQQPVQLEWTGNGERFILRYDTEGDFLQVEFHDQPEMTYDYEDGDEGVFVKRDKVTSRIRALGIADFVHRQRFRSRPLHRFLLKFGVTIPPDFVADIVALETKKSRIGQK